MDARLTEAFTEYERLVERVARLRYELAGAEAQLAHERDVLIGAARAGAPPAVKVATARPVKAPARTAPKPKAAAAPAPKAAPAAPDGTWTPKLAERLMTALDASSSVLRQIIADGGSVPIAKVPTVDGESYLAESGVPMALSSWRVRARKAGISLPVVTQAAGRVVIDPGLVTAWRTHIEGDAQPRAHRVAVDVSAP